MFTVVCYQMRIIKMLGDDIRSERVTRKQNVFAYITFLAVNVVLSAAAVIH